MVHRVERARCGWYNLDMVPRVRKSYEDALAKNEDNETIKTGHKNFLREAVDVLYLFHHTKEAQELFADLHTRYPDDENAHDLPAFQSILKNAVAWAAKK